ncbi:Beta-lactamase class C [Minicystis rosea]|nr:Beta-lactamase class C [Minicystis rosea]
MNERIDLDLTARLDGVLERALAASRVVGAVVLVARDGALVARRAVGLADRERGVPMREDTRFRLASMTKPIVTVAALALVERGVLGLDDPATRFLPDFAPTFAGRAAPITIRHLLTHTSGLGYAFLEPRDGPYHAAGVSDGLDQPGLSIAENLRRLATLPLYFEPGTAFRYSLATDVLGEIMARATGETLPVLVKKLVTDPLELSETSFAAVPEDTLATPYADGDPPVRMSDGIYVPFAGAGAIFAPSRASDPRSYPSGGAGMLGTAPEFLRFLEALRTRHPFAPRHWIDQMLGDRIAPITSPILGDGWGYGFGVGVLRDPKLAGSPLNAGSARWGGAYGHAWWIDETARISALLMTNTAFEGMAGSTRDEIQRAVYGA